MKRWFPLVSSFLLTLVLAVGLTLIEMDISNENDRSTLNPSEQPEVSRPVYLDNDNIVDVMAHAELNSRLARVQIKPELLAIDMYLPAQAAQADMVSDFVTLAQLSFRQTANIHQLLVRVLLKDHTGNELLLASWEAERNVWEKLGNSGDKTVSRMIPEMNGFRLTEAGEVFFKP